MKYYVGVDVGTSSVRAALAEDNGKIVQKSSFPIEIWSSRNGFYQQSSENIWQSCVQAVRTVTADISNKSNIRGIGFDATCSLVVLNAQMNPVSISIDGQVDQNVIMWMDHRAKDEAEKISATNHPMLQFVGGQISLEMQPPKLLWLKKNLHETCWKNAAHFLDLPDFMTYKATGHLTRSLCSTVCKWLFVSNAQIRGKPDGSFWSQIGLEDVSMDNYSKIGCDSLLPGQPLAGGLTSEAAFELGLNPGTAVGTSIIDAHAGTLGLLACHAEYEDELTSRLAIICGTSSCHMALSTEKIFTKGVWGPYFSVVLPNLWLNEGGQSATGKLLDHIIENHAAYAKISENPDSCHIQEKLNEILEMLSEKHDLASPSMLTQNVHVWPDFHGNRSPLADPSLTGMISGLTLDSSPENLALVYLATVQAIAYGSRHIKEALEESGHNFSSIFICGGLGKNKLFVQVHADILGLPVYLPMESESVLLGSAILGATASGDFTSIGEAMTQMGGSARKIDPRLSEQRFNDLKYKVFLKMYEDQKSYENIMSANVE